MEYINEIGCQGTLDDYMLYFQKLNTRSIRLIEKMVEPGVQYKGPFDDVQGVEAFEMVLQKASILRGQSRLHIQDYAWGQAGNVAYVRWTLSYQILQKVRRIDGVSELMFSKRGKIMAHHDHWDAGEAVYEHIPLLGAAVRRSKSKISTRG